MGGIFSPYISQNPFKIRKSQIRIISLIIIILSQTKSAKAIRNYFFSSNIFILPIPSGLTTLAFR
ncbi:hypothetical protein ABIE50_003547 [Chitinophaga sp. OAE865]